MKSCSARWICIEVLPSWTSVGGTGCTRAHNCSRSTQHTRGPTIRKMIYACSALQLCELDAVQMPLPRREAHLHLVCFPMMRVEWWRALWHCDSAVALEHSRHA